MATRGRRQDHYDVLGVTFEAPNEVIRAAYRALATKYHPDRNPGDRDAELRLKRLNAAWAVLGDPAKKKQYDELTQSPEANDDASEEVPYQVPKPAPPRSENPKVPAGPEPRWKVPDDDDRPRSDTNPAEPSPVERVATRAAGGFGRVVGWLAGFALVAAVIAALRGDGCEGRRRDSTSAAATAQQTTAAVSAPMPSSTTPEPETWDTWTLDGGRFTLTFPTEPHVKPMGLEDGLHWVRYVSYRPTDGPDSAGYVAVFVDRPPASTEDALRELRDVAMGGSKVVLYDRRLSAGGLPAEELAFRRDNGSQRQARVMIASTRACLLWVDSPTGYDEGEAARRFFASFRATGAEPGRARAPSGTPSAGSTQQPRPIAAVQDCDVQRCMQEQSACEVACNPRCALGAGVNQACMERCMKPCRDQESTCEHSCGP
jgi:hypothetical protein